MQVSWPPCFSTTISLPIAKPIPAPLPTGLVVKKGSNISGSCNAHILQVFYVNGRNTSQNAETEV